MLILTFLAVTNLTAMCMIQTQDEKEQTKQTERGALDYNKDESSETDDAITTYIYLW
jgi:hypothetical protein